MFDARKSMCEDLMPSQPNGNRPSSNSLPTYTKMEFIPRKREVNFTKVV